MEFLSRPPFIIFEIRFFSVIREQAIQFADYLGILFLPPSFLLLLLFWPFPHSADIHKTGLQGRKEISNQFCLLIDLVQFVQKEMKI